MNSVLLVIDVQPVFPAARHVIPECLDEIYQANREKNPIIFLEFWPQDPVEDHLIEACHTFPVLKAAAPQAQIVRKYQQDGTSAMVAYLEHIFGHIPSLRVCGVNTELCVLETVRGLARRTAHGVVVASQACHSLYNHRAGLRLMSRLARVLVA